MRVKQNAVVSRVTKKKCVYSVRNHNVLRDGYWFQFYRLFISKKTSCPLLFSLEPFFILFFSDIFCFFHFSFWFLPLQYFYFMLFLRIFLFFLVFIPFGFTTSICFTFILSYFPLQFFFPFFFARSIRSAFAGWFLNIFIVTIFHWQNRRVHSLCSSSLNLIHLFIFFGCIFFSFILGFLLPILLEQKKIKISENRSTAEWRVSKESVKWKNNERRFFFWIKIDIRLYWSMEVKLGRYEASINSDATKWGKAFQKTACNAFYSHKRTNEHV